VKQILVLILLMSLSWSLQAKKPNTAELGVLHQATAKYRNAKMVQMDLEKIVVSELTGKQINYKGTIYLSAGLFRVVHTEPEKSTLVFDGSTVWNEQPPSEEFPGPVQVTKTKLTGKNKSQILFATLLTKDPITKHFEIMDSKSENGVTIYEAKPLSSEIAVMNLVLKVQNKDKQVSEISYKDDLGNLTRLKFSKPKFKSAVDKKIFRYSPPKGAQVNEL
jgi:outer membrane lipoprotein carrier protein